MTLTAETRPAPAGLARPLKDRVALVTGATRGIGLAIAVELAKAGATVVLNHHPDMSEAEVSTAESAVAEAGGAHCSLAADVSDPDAVDLLVKDAISAFGHVDILVNNAGITRDRTLKKMEVDDWDRVIEVDLRSVFLVTRSVLPGMIERGWGRIVSISSVVAQSGNFGQTNYAAAKAGIIGFTKSLALEVARYNVTVNAICPGFTETPMTAAIPPEVREKIVGRIPLGRFARPEEIAQAVLFAVTNDYATG